MVTAVLFILSAGSILVKGLKCDCSHRTEGQGLKCDCIHRAKAGQGLKCDVAIGQKEVKV